MATPKDLMAPTEAVKNTIIGHSILISGKLVGDEDLTVRGRVEGELSLTRTLIVEPTGVVKANVSVKNAIVSGVVVGNISATESVELTREGRMVGDIRAPRVIIVDGASFRGRVDMGEAEPGRPAAERPALPRPVVAPAPRPAAAPARPALPAARPTTAAPARPAPAPAARPAPPPAPAARPVPPPAPAAAPKAEARPAEPPKPPAPPAMADAGKKKVVVKKKA